MVVTKSVNKNNNKFCNYNDNHLKKAADSAPKTACISNTYQTMHNV